MKIWIKYVDFAAVESQAVEYRYLRFEDFPVTAGEIGLTLGQIYYSHQYSRRNKYTLVISADSLADTAKYYHLKNAFVFKKIKYSFDNVTYKDALILDDGDFPVQYVEGSIYLPELTFNIADIVPRTGNY